MALGPMPAGVPGGGLPPGMAAPPGGTPPGMQAPPGNLGPHTIPQGNPGNIMKAMQQVMAATQMIGEALPQIPMGSEGHTKLMKIHTDLVKLVSESKDKMMQVQTLLAQLKSAQAQGQQHMMAPAAPPPNQGPAMPSPGGGAPPPA